MKNKRTNIFLGLILIIIGMIALLGSLNIIKFNMFFNGWWTVFIIVPSIVNMLEEKVNLGNTFSLLLGILLLLVMNDIITIGNVFKFVLPGLLIMFGIYVLFLTTKKDNNSFLFSSKTLELDKENNDINTLFSTVHVNIKKNNKKNIFLKVDELFSEVIIHLPKDVKVITDASKLFADVIDCREYNNNDDYNCTLHIKINSICGDIVLK